MLRRSETSPLDQTHSSLKKQKYSSSSSSSHCLTLLTLATLSIQLLLLLHSSRRSHFHKIATPASSTSTTSLHTSTKTSLMIATTSPPPGALSVTSFPILALDQKPPTSQEQSLTTSYHLGTPLISSQRNSSTTIAFSLTLAALPTPLMPQPSTFPSMLALP